MLRPGLRFVDQRDPALYPLAIGALIVFAALAWWPALRRRGWLIGLISFVCLLAPVLPLRNHVYHYYLYVPLLAASWCLACAADARFERMIARWTHSRGAMWAIACFCCLVLTWNGARLVAQMERRPSPVYPGLMGDPIVDRARIAERAIRDLRAASVPPGSDMVFVMRERISLLGRIRRGSGEDPPPDQEVYPETNVRVALFDGIGVRALVPAIDSVSFARTLEAASARRRYAVYAPTGEVEVFDAASLDSLLNSPWVTRW